MNKSQWYYDDRILDVEKEFPAYDIDKKWENGKQNIK